MRENAEPTFLAERYKLLRQRTSIDMMNIDEELSEMPFLLQDAGECVAFAIEVRDRAKEDLQRTDAEIAEQLRNTPLQSGRARSETAVESQIPLSKLHEEKLTSLSIARLDAALWQTLLEALRTKSFAIRTTADLITAGFITPDFIREKRREQIRKAPVKETVAK